MPILILLILASLGIAVLFLVGFMWAARTGQFEDTYTPSLRILTDEPAINHQLPTTTHQPITNHRSPSTRDQT